MALFWVQVGVGKDGGDKFLSFAPIFQPFRFKYRYTAFMVLSFDALPTGFENAGQDGPFIRSEFSTSNSLNHGGLSICPPCMPQSLLVRPGLLYRSEYPYAPGRFSWLPVGRRWKESLAVLTSAIGQKRTLNITS